MSSRAVFENSFISNRGIETAMASLTHDEVAVLHLLRHMNKAVDISFFNRIYGNKDSRPCYWKTYNQLYKTVYKQVMTSLVRKGLLIGAEVERWQADSKLERIRFRFPLSFSVSLSSLFASTETFEVKGRQGKDVARAKLMAFLQESHPKQDKKNTEDHIHIRDGELLIGKSNFSVKRLDTWRFDNWKKALWPGKKAKQLEIPPIKAVMYLFGQLAGHEWIMPAELKGVLQIFLHGSELPDVKKLCEKGWSLGILAKHENNGKSYYRARNEVSAPQPDPASGIDATVSGLIRVDLSKVSYSGLEALAQIATFAMTSAGLEAQPDIKKIGRAWPSWSEHPVWNWLNKNSPVFRSTMETTNSRRNKTIVHKDLLIAKVRDLSLRVRIEKALADPQRLIVMDDEYIAFPEKSLRTIEKVVQKSGHVMKSVKSK